MTELYTQEQENKFVETLKIKKNKMITSRSLSTNAMELQKSKLTNTNKKLPQQYMNERFGQHFSLLKQSINNMEEECHKYGGLQFIRQELDRNEITKEQYVKYCTSRISKNFELPKIKIRSQSQSDLNKKGNLKSDRNGKISYNKWFIDPKERFSKSKGQTKYDWNRQSFILNIVRDKTKALEHQFLPKFINNCKNKLNRQPLLCKYTAIKTNDKS